MILAIFLSVFLESRGIDDGYLCRKTHVESSDSDHVIYLCLKDPPVITLCLINVLRSFWVLFHKDILCKERKLEIHRGCSVSVILKISILP